MLTLFSAPTIASLTDVFRKEPLPADEINVLLAALIVLRWADFQESEREAIAAFDETLYEPVLPDRLRWRHLRNLLLYRAHDVRHDDLSTLLQSLRTGKQDALAHYLYCLAEPLSRIGHISSAALEAMLDWLEAQPFETPRDRRALLDSFDEMFASQRGRGTGDYRTPTAITKLIAGLTAPHAGESVYDPCFGTAGLLTAAIDYVALTEKEAGRRRANQLDIVGIEINTQIFVVGLARLLLAGIEEPHLEVGNSLERDFRTSSGQKGYDLVVANPPWGLRMEPTGLDHYPVRTSDATALFIQHALFQLRPGGRAAVVVPNGILFKGGAERQFRRWLLENHTLDAIISLPAGAFLPYTGVQASILLLRRGEPTSRIRMVDAETLFERAPESRGLSLSDRAMIQIVDAAKTQSPSEIAWDVEIDAIVRLDWDLTARRQQQSGLVGSLDLSRDGTKAEVLGDLCEILSGVSAKPGWLTNSVQADGLVPYVRIKDVQLGVAAKGSSWLTQDGLSHLDAKAKLRSGDILLSKSGTIGRTGIVRNGAVGAFAASGFYVVRLKSEHTERLDPHYLLAYLCSKEISSLLFHSARTYATQRLPMNFLMTLAVVVPPLQMQERVADQFREQGAAPFGFFALLTGLAEQDPIGEWVESAFLLLPPEGAPIRVPVDFAPIDVMATQIRPIQALRREASGPLLSWLLLFAEAIGLLRDIQSVPKGPGLLSILQDTSARLEKAQQQISGRLPVEARARSLTDTVHRMVKATMADLADDVRLVVTANTSRLNIGEEVQIELLLRNEGALPLRELQVSTEPDWGTIQLAYLAEQQQATISLSGLGPKVVGSFEISVDWTARTLDGRPVNGQRQIAFEVLTVAPQKGNEPMEMGASPYVCGDPVRPDRKDIFFGREELLERIRRTVTHSGNVVLLEGNRRAGKSSILLHLAGRDRVPGWLGVYCSLQGAEGSREGVGVPTVEVFRVIASSIAKELHALGGTTPLPNGSSLAPGVLIGIAKACREGISEQSPFADLQDYVDVVLSALESHGLGLLLMLDEFDKLQEGIDNGVTSPQVPENIRYLVQTRPRFSAILTGSRRLKRLREQYWSALFGLGTREGVTALDEPAARHLVTEPVAGKLIYTREAVDYAIRVTARQPYILQCLCNRVFDLAANLNTRSVNLDLVQEAAHKLIDGWEHFAFLWGYVQTDRRRFVLALCHRAANGPDPMTFRVLQEHLAQHGVEASDEALIADIEFLKELELLELEGASGAGRYRLAIPLMGEWIDQQQDFEVLRSKARSENEDDGA